MQTLASVTLKLRTLSLYQKLFGLVLIGIIGALIWRHPTIAHGRSELPGKGMGARLAGGSASHSMAASPAASEIMKLVASDRAADDEFGVYLALSGDILVVGAHQHDVGSNGNQGAAYIFERNQGEPDNWSFLSKLTGSDGAAENYFGATVAIEGDTIVVGGYGNDSSKGAVYVFERNQSTNNWGEIKKLTASDGLAGDDFGRSVAISGDTVIIGSPLDDDGRGSAYIYDRNQGGANNWGEVKKLVPADSEPRDAVEPGDAVGRWVAIYNNTIVVTAPQQASSRGAAYIYDRDQGGTNNWGLAKKLLASDSAVGDSLEMGWRLRAILSSLALPETMG